MPYLFTLIILLSLNLWAAPHNVQMNMLLEIDGKKVTSKIINVELGVPAVILQSDSANVQTVIEAIAVKDKNHPNELVHVEATVRKVIAGKQYVISTPKILARYGEAAEIEIKNEQDQGLRFRVRVQKNQ